ncbi:MAG: hypothetical protein GX110_06875, partial [Synergistaceae bacterium]|nr:hypothetical protein [Synergistaceae bacterium]
VSDLCGHRMAALFAKRILAGLFRGMPGVGGLRRAAASVSSWTDLRGIIEQSGEYFERREEYSGCTH